MKGSPFQTLFVTTRARPDFGNFEMTMRYKSSSPLRLLGGYQLSSNFFSNWLTTHATFGKNSRLKVPNVLANNRVGGALFAWLYNKLVTCCADQGSQDA